MAPTLATMIGLGVGIDYALFIVTRHREQRRDGHGHGESIARSVATSGGAVAVRRLHGHGRPALAGRGRTSRWSRRSATRRRIVVAMAMTAALTLLPAILGAGRRPRSTPCGCRSRRAKQDDREPHGWGRWGGFVARIRCRARWSPWWCSSRWPARRSTSTSASRTTARCPRAPTPGAPPTASPPASAPGTNGPLLIAVDCPSSRPRPTSRS